MAVSEPAVAHFVHNPAAKYLAATRPPFLLAAFVPCFIGLATAHLHGVAIQWFTALLTVIGAVVIHAGVNVLNDYYDALNGTDARNTERLYPFTGGSRFIQNGVLSEAQTARFGAALMGVGMLVGVALLPHAGPDLLWVGIAGLILGWAYSAPPLALNSRGVGEVSVGIGFGSLIPLGADMVQRGGFDALPLVASLPYALLATCLLFINQFPDRAADAAAGKHHWVVRLGPARARWGYLFMVTAAYGALLGFAATDVLPAWSLLGMASAPLSLVAALYLLRHAHAPSRLAPAIVLTIAALVVHGLAVSAGLFLAT